MIYYGLFFLGLLSTIGIYPQGRQRLAGYVDPKSRNLILWYIFLVVVVVVVGLRDNVGRDFPSYVRSFTTFENSGNSRFEPGFQVLYFLAVELNLGYPFVFLLSAFLANFFVFKRVSELSNSLAFSTVILFGTDFFFRETNLVRQAIALGVFFYSIRYLIKPNLAKYLALVVLASMFHYTALLMLPMYWVITRWHARALLVAFSAVGLLFALDPMLYKRLFEVFANFVPDGYSHYIPKFEAALSSVSEGKRIVFESIAGLVLCLFIKIEKNSEQQKIVYFNLLVVGLIIQACFGRIWALSRISSYLTMFQAICVPYFVSNSNLGKPTRMVLGTLLVAYYCLFIVDAISRNSHSILPYDTVLSSLF